MMMLVVRIGKECQLEIEINKMMRLNGRQNTVVGRVEHDGMQLKDVREQAGLEGYCPFVFDVAGFNVAVTEAAKARNGTMVL
jgi:hypothetical protein